jgi:hypothetical protein
MEGRAVRHNFERDHPCQVCLDLNVIFYQNMPNFHNRYKSAERKISQKNPEYMLIYSFPCSCSKNLSSIRFIIKQQWTIEEMPIFSNISHLEWRAGLSDTILKGTIPARFGLIWFRGFRGEDLNVKVYDVRLTPSDGKRPGELKSAFQPIPPYIFHLIYIGNEYKIKVVMNFRSMPK